MSIQYKAWVSETGTLTGTDPTYTLPGTASTPSGNQFFRKVSAAFTATATVVLTITAATGAETSVWTYTPGTSGAAGTISRVTLLESSTGSAINWSGVAANISGDIPSPVLTSGGAASAGQIPALGAGGEMDFSLLPDNFQAAAAALSGGSPLGYANALDTFNEGNAVENRVTLNGWGNYWLYRWRGPRNITSVSVGITTAGTSTYGLGIMSINSSGLTLIQTITANGISDATTGLQTLAAGTAFTEFSLPQGDYVMQMVYATAGTKGVFVAQSSRVPADSPNFGWIAAGGGSTGGATPAMGFLNNPGQSALASSFSGKPNGGFFSAPTFPKIWMNGTN